MLCYICNLVPVAGGLACYKCYKLYKNDLKSDWIRALKSDQQRAKRTYVKELEKLVSLEQIQASFAEREREN